MSIATATLNGTIALITAITLTVLSAPGLRAQDVLPVPPAPFKGQIGLNAKDSKPDFPQPVEAPKGAPNVLLVLLDDVGFGASSTFGGPANTQVSRRGIR